MSTEREKRWIETQHKLWTSDLAERALNEV
jgi:hypothetical protein